MPRLQLGAVHHSTPHISAQQLNLAERKKNMGAITSVFALIVIATVSTIVASSLLKREVCPACKKKKGKLIRIDENLLPGQKEDDQITSYARVMRYRCTTCGNKWNVPNGTVEKYIFAPR